MVLPEMIRIRQRVPREQLADVAATLRDECAACGVSLHPGQRIALAVGSRGIAHLVDLVRETVCWVRAQGADPFIVPAMGSHGGATAEGQRAVLEGYGITEVAVGAPIHSSMEVVELPRDGLSLPVYLDRYAAEADGIIVINRVKPHTSFHGRYESGLMKMLAIGLGKHRQALAIHECGVNGLRTLMPQVAQQVLRHGKVVLGVAVVEDAREETIRVCAIPAARIPDEEPALLELARSRMPKLPVEALDLLIVDRMGKNISGLGMDTNIIGRLKIQGQPEPSYPAIRVILVRDLTEDSHGNATGVGLADIITQRLFAKIDRAATYANVLTTGFLERGKIPLVAQTDQEALIFAGRAIGMTDLAEARVMRIQDTLHLEELQVSASVLDTLRDHDDIEVLGSVGAMLLPSGELAPFAGDA